MNWSDSVEDCTNFFSFHGNGAIDISTPQTLRIIDHVYKLLCCFYSSNCLREVLLAYSGTENTDLNIALPVWVKKPKKSCIWSMKLRCYSLATTSDDLSWLGRVGLVYMYLPRKA